MKKKWKRRWSIIQIPKDDFKKTMHKSWNKKVSFRLCGVLYVNGNWLFNVKAKHKLVEYWPIRKKESKREKKTQHNKIEIETAQNKCNIYFYNIRSRFIQCVRAKKKKEKLNEVNESEERFSQYEHHIISTV